jgi:anti-sigma factor RsiW
MNDAPRETPVFDCEQTVRLLWDYLDGQLGAVDLAAVDAHLASCERCPPHFAFEQRFLDAMREARAAVHSPDASTLQAMRRRVIARLADAGELIVPGGQP